MFQTISVILDYLEESDKIAYKKNVSIIWIFRGAGNIKKC